MDIERYIDFQCTESVPFYELCETLLLDNIF